MNATCTNMLKLCHLRVVRLGADGSPLVGASSLYETASPITLQYTPVTPTRESFTQLNGCGDTCAAFSGPSRAVDTVNLTMDLCALDAELIEMLCGGSVITDGSYGTIGYLAASDSTLNEFGVGIETWAIQWNKRQRAILNGQPAWYRHLFPLTKWEVGQVKQENAFSTIPLTAVGEVNSGYGSGLADDPFPVAIDDHAYGWVIDDAKPAEACGYQAIAA